MMKRLLPIALWLICMIASAQNVPTKWTSTRYEADALTGQQAYTAYRYALPGTGSIVTFGWNRPEFRITTEKGIFKETTYYTGFGESLAVQVLVGIYDISTGEPVLIDRFNIFMDKEDNSLGDRIVISSGSLKREKKKALKILQALTTKNRIVRFLCPRYADTTFELCVPYYQE